MLHLRHRKEAAKNEVVRHSEHSESNHDGVITGDFIQSTTFIFQQ